MTPSVIFRVPLGSPAEAAKLGVMPDLDPDLLAILVCPRCHGALTHRPEVPALDCPACRLRYSIDDGIPVLLLDSATPLPEASPA